jgi:prepilin peptidase CpaA
MTMVTLLTHQLIMWCVLLLLLWAAVSDLTRFIIPNTIPTAMVALFPVHVLAIGPSLGTLGHVGVAGVVFLVGVGLFALRTMGGGDVKLLAAVSLWAGPSLVLPFLFITALAGGVLALILMTPFKHFLPAVSAAGTPFRLQGRRQPMPYGLAITAGGVFVIVQMAASFPGP